MKTFRPLETPECPFSNLPESRSGRWGAGLTAAKMKDCRWLLCRMRHSNHNVECRTMPRRVLPVLSLLRSASFCFGIIGKTLELLIPDNPFGRAIPAPCGLLTLEVNTAEPSIDAVQVDVICATFKNLLPCFCDRDLTQPVLRCVRVPAFSPAFRFGFAWDIFGTGKTAVCGGFGQNLRRENDFGDRKGNLRRTAVVEYGLGQQGVAHDRTCHKKNRRSS